MRKFFTKKLALTVTVASLLAVQVSGVAAATFSDYVNNYVTASDSTQTDVTTPSDLTGSDSTSSDVTTPSDSTNSDTTGGNNAGTPASTGSDVIGNLPQGDHSLPATVAKDEIVKSDAVNDVLNNEVTSSTETKVDVVSDAAPTLSADLFSAVKANNKDITVGVVNSQDYLLYSWTFKAATLNNTDKNVDFTLNVSDTKNDDCLLYTSPSPRD